MQTIIYAAFCGTGKTYLCNTFPNDYLEIECWKYENKEDYPNNYVKDVLDKIGKVKYILISTNPYALKELYKRVDKITLVYPDKSLREEYMERYCKRDSSCDFIGAMYKYWVAWLDELKEQDYCNHIVLKSGQYIKDVI